MEDGGATTVAAAGVGDCGGVVEGLVNGDPKTDAGFPWFPMFATTGADVDAPKGEKDAFAFTESRRVDGTSVEPEALGTEELDPKAELEFLTKRRGRAATSAERRTSAEAPIPKRRLASS
jgi:hypothetical protein